MIFHGLRHICGRLTHSIAVVAVIAALTLMSCSHNDAPDMPAGEDQTGMIAFSVVTFKTIGTPAASRATWADEYDKETGNNFDTRLLKDQLYVIITDETCRNEYAVTNLVCTDSVDNGITVAYNYKGHVNEEDLDKIAGLVNGKLHIIANVGYNRPQFRDENTFSRYGQPDGIFTAIPMWGVKQINDLSGIKDPTKIFDFKEVALLRSMAKIVIDSDKDDKNFIKSIRSVTMSAINPYGYLFPQGWEEVTDTKTLDRDALHIPLQEQIGDVDFTFKENHAEFYLPEIKNPLGDNELKLTLTFETKDSKLRTGYLYFRRYSDGEPTDFRYDIRRNYLYKYSVRMDASDLSVEVDVDPYSIIELDPIFGLTHPTLPSLQEP